VILKYYGHAFFTWTLENGTVIAHDPYGEFYEYPLRSVKADYCLVSHHHHDHDGISSLKPGTVIIDEGGKHHLENDISIQGVPTWHDEVQGAKRGPNTIWIIEAEGMRVGHAGDLGHVPDAKQAKQIGHLDVLLLPVGGYYTIDPKEAIETCRLLQPSVVVPMHYRTRYDEEMPVAGVEEFLKLVKAENAQMPLVRFAKADLMERPPVITLAIQPREK